MVVEKDKEKVRDIEVSKEYLVIGQGNTAEILQYEENKILKLFREGMPYFTIFNEYQMSLQVQKVVSNVPKAFELVRYKNRYGIVYEKIQGKNMIEVLFGDLVHYKSYAKKLASIHAQLHEKNTDITYTVKHKLIRDIDSVNELSPSEKMKIKSYLNLLDDQNKLCHFDFHPGNIMLRGDECIIIDWMTACAGNPCADVARTLLLLKMGEMSHIHPCVQKALHLLMARMGRVYKKEYMRLTQVTEEQINSWMLPVAAARLCEWLTDHERKKLVQFVKEQLARLNL